MPTTPSFTLRGIRDGWIAASPLALGVAAYGFLFGVLAAGVQMTALEASLLSTFVYSGSAQLALVQSWSASASSIGLVITVLIVNARYIVYGATLQPRLAGLGWGRVFCCLAIMGDANWALSLRRFEDGNDDAGFLMGSGLVMFLPWVASTIAGHQLGQVIVNPAALGLDFMLVAFSAALLVEMWRSPHDLLHALAAFAFAAALATAGYQVWAVVVAGLAAGGVAYLRHDDQH